MSHVTSRTLSSFKYAYIVAFFLLMASIFQPLTTGNGVDKMIAGLFILLLGLSGGFVLWKSTHNESNRILYMTIGFGLVGASLYLIFMII